MKIFDFRSGMRLPVGRHVRAPRCCCPSTSACRETSPGRAGRCTPASGRSRSTGPVMVRRLNIDGDGQGDLAGHGGEQRAVMVYQARVLPALAAAPRPRRPGLRDVRRELHRRRAARRRGVHRRPLPHRRGRVRGHPAAGHLLPRRAAPGRAADARAAGAHHRPGFYLRVLREGHVRAGRRDRPDRRRAAERLTVADIDALLYLPGPDRGDAARRAAHPGAEPRLAGLVPRPARRRERAAGRPHRAPAGPASARCGSRASSTRPTVVTSVYLAAPTASRCRPPGAGQYLTIRLTGAGRAAPVRNYSLSAAPRRRLPDQRQARAARRGQQLPRHRARGRARPWTSPRRAASSCSTTAPARSS